MGMGYIRSGKVSGKILIFNIIVLIGIYKAIGGLKVEEKGQA
jgi:hypothetical protein